MILPLTILYNDSLVKLLLNSEYSDEYPVIGEDCIGKAILKNVGHYFKDSDTIYVRNDLMQVDFEIGLQHKSFSRDVLGLED